MTRSLKIPHQMIMSAFQITGTKAQKGFKSLAQKKTRHDKGRSWDPTPQGLSPRHVTWPSTAQQLKVKVHCKGQQHKSGCSDLDDTQSQTCKQISDRVTARGQSEQDRGEALQGRMHVPPAGTSWPARFTHFLAPSSTCAAPDEHRTRKGGLRDVQGAPEPGTNRPPHNFPSQPFTAAEASLPCCVSFLPNLIFQINASSIGSAGSLHLEFHFWHYLERGEGSVPGVPWTEQQHPVLPMRWHVAPTAEFTLTLQALVTTTGVDSKSFSLELLKDQERDNPWIVAHWNLDFSAALRGGHIPFISHCAPWSPSREQPRSGRSPHGLPECLLIRRS